MIYCWTKGMKKFISAIEDTIRALIEAERMAGSESALATIIGVSRQLLNHWKLTGQVPYKKGIAISIFTCGKVSLYRLCPEDRDLTERFEKMILEKFNHA